MITAAERMTIERVRIAARAGATVASRDVLTVLNVYEREIGRETRSETVSLG